MARSFVVVTHGIGLKMAPKSEERTSEGPELGFDEQQKPLTRAEVDSHVPYLAAPSENSPRSARPSLDRLFYARAITPGS